MISKEEIMKILDSEAETFSVHSTSHRDELSGQFYSRIEVGPWNDVRVAKIMSSYIHDMIDRDFVHAKVKAI